MDSSGSSIYYTVTDKDGQTKHYRVPGHLRVVAHALLSRWQERMDCRGHFQATWSLHKQAPAHARIIKCYECANCGGIVDSDGFGPLDCGCHMKDWHGFGRVLSAVMNLRGHNQEEVARRLGSVTAEEVNAWLAGKAAPGERCQGSVRRYLQTAPGLLTPEGPRGGTTLPATAD